MPIRAPRGMGWDVKNRPMGWDGMGSSHPTRSPDAQYIKNVNEIVFF
jgi:hypothetical protein